MRPLILILSVNDPNISQHHRYIVYIGCSRYLQLLFFINKLSSPRLPTYSFRPLLYFSGCRFLLSPYLYSSIIVTLRATAATRVSHPPLPPLLPFIILIMILPLLILSISSPKEGFRRIFEASLMHGWKHIFYSIPMHFLLTREMLWSHALNNGCSIITSLPMAVFLEDWDPTRSSSTNISFSGHIWFSTDDGVGMLQFFVGSNIWAMISWQWLGSFQIYPSFLCMLSLVMWLKGAIWSI